jgi:predicted PurR-regulated permease PerM
MISDLTREAVPRAVPWDLARIMFAVVGIGGLIAASFLVLRPFLPAVIWATMIVVATWPTLRAVQTRLWGKRSLAVAVMTLVMLAVLAIPLTVAVLAIVDRADDVVTWSRSLIARPVPELPAWVIGLPFVGKKLAAEWSKITSAPSDELAGRITPHIREVAHWLIAQAGSLGTLLLQFLLTVAMAAILYARGETVGRSVLAFANRLAGSHGARAVLLSAGAIRAVALGIVVTAVVQALIGGIGLALTGVPHAVLLTCVMLMLGVAQIGPAPVLIGSVIWLYAGGQTVWGTVMLAWSLLTMSFDNILRPLLIKKGADLPLLLIIAGVVGGLLAFGLVGLFIGPVILAVAYTLLVAWVSLGDPAADGWRESGDMTRSSDKSEDAIATLK